MTFTAYYLTTRDGAGYTDWTGSFPTIAEAITAAIAEQDKAWGHGYDPNWAMIEDEDGNIVADCTKDQLDAIRQGYQNPVDLARFHVEGPDFYKTATITDCPF